jgi:MFS-type transporter involved in bile tolerance (Atg22 family)
MWKQYRKTFVGMQVVVAMAASAILWWSRVPGLAALFFLVMQMAAVVGAFWGARLDRRLRKGFALPPSA